MGSQELFERYLAADNPDPEAALRALLTEHATPILSRAVRGRLGSLYTAADASELAGEAMLELLRRLRTLRSGFAEPPSYPFDALAGGVAANTVHRFFARRFPERNRLRKRLRYLLETSPRFRLSTGPDGATLCALATTAPEAPLASAADLERCLAALRHRPVPVHPFEAFVFRLLKEIARPLELSRLTALAAEITGLREPVTVSNSAPVTSATGEELPPHMPADPAPLVPERLELNERLSALWRDVLRLAPRHRTALLLSARDSGAAALWLLTDLGVATFREVAAALDMTRQELAALWSRLPLSDNEIAERLGLDRQQVINLRSTARISLERKTGAAGFQYPAKPIKGDIR